MRRVGCEERANWREIAQGTGFDFHTIDDAPYWDERAYYAFTLEQIERDIELPTAELDAMCRELVTRAVDDERIMQLLQIPRRFWNWIAASFKRGEPRPRQVGNCRLVSRALEEPELREAGLKEIDVEARFHVGRARSKAMDVILK